MWEEQLQLQDSPPQTSSHVPLGGASEGSGTDCPSWDSSYTGEEHWYHHRLPDPAAGATSNETQEPHQSLPRAKANCQRIKEEALTEGDSPERCWGFRWCHASVALRGQSGITREPATQELPVGVEEAVIGITSRRDSTDRETTDRETTCQSIHLLAYSEVQHHCPFGEQCARNELDKRQLCCSTARTQSSNEHRLQDITQNQ